MPYMQWTDDLRVGVAEVDQQHRTLVGLVNELHDAMLAGRGKDALASTIGGLVEYTGTHFATEERLFDAYAYPMAPGHKLQHRDFVRQVEDFQRGFDEDRLMLSLDVMDFLSNWLVDHIQGSDRAFGPFLNARGVV